MSSLHIQSDGSNGPSPRTWTPAPAANVPLRVCGRRRRQPPATPLPRGSLPNCPAAPIPPGRCGNSVVLLAGASGPKVSKCSRLLASPALLGSLRAVPAPRAPAGRRKRPRLCPRSPAGLLFRNLPPSPSIFRTKKIAMEGLRSSPEDTPPPPEPWGTCPKGPISPSSWTLQGSTRSHPYRRAPMIRSPAHFESLPGSPAAKGRSPKRTKLWKATATFGDRPCIAKCPPPLHPWLSRAAYPGREELGEVWICVCVCVGGHDRLHWGPWTFISGREQVVGLSGHCVPTALPAPNDLS